MLDQLTTFFIAVTSFIFGFTLSRLTTPLSKTEKQEMLERIQKRFGIVSRTQIVSPVQKAQQKKFLTSIQRSGEEEL